MELQVIFFKPVFKITRISVTSMTVCQCDAQYYHQMVPKCQIFNPYIQVALNRMVDGMTYFGDCGILWSLDDMFCPFTLCSCSLSINI